MGMFKIDDSKYQSFEEIRKIDRILKEELGYTKNEQQPWTIRKEKSIHTVTVKYSFLSEIEYEKSFFATEDAKVNRESSSFTVLTVVVVIVGLLAILLFGRNFIFRIIHKQQLRRQKNQRRRSR